MTAVQIEQPKSKSHLRPPGRPKYVLESVNQSEESVLFTLRREVLWSVAHLFSSAETHLPGEDVDTLKQLGGMIETVAKVISGVNDPSCLTMVETVIDSRGNVTTNDVGDVDVFLHDVDLQSGFVRISLVSDEILLAGKLLQGIFEFLDDGMQTHDRPEPRSWSPLRSLGNKLLILADIISGILDAHEYLQIADEMLDEDGVNMNSAAA